MVWVALYLLYGFTLLVKYSFIEAPSFISSYLADLLAIPLLLYPTRLFIRWWFKWPRWEFSIVQIVFICIYVGLCFEVMLPKMDRKYTADVWDMVCYILGSVLYACGHLRSKQKTL